MKHKKWKRALSALTSVVMLAGPVPGQIFSALSEPALAANAEESTYYVQIGNDNYDTSTTDGVPVNCLYDYGWSEQIYTAEEIGDLSIIDAIEFKVFEGIGMDYDMSLYLMDTDAADFNSNIGGFPLEDASMVWSGSPDFTSSGWVRLDFQTPYEHATEKNLVVIAEFTCNNPNPDINHPFAAFGIESNEALVYNSDFHAPPGEGSCGAYIDEKNIIRLYSPNPPSISVTYHSNDPAGSDQVYDDEAFLTVPYDLKGDIFDCDGYTFVGWNSQDDGYGLFYPAGFEFEEGLTEHTDFYAQWDQVPEDAVQIGVTTVNSYNLPLSSIYNYGFSEQIYTAKEIGDIDKIDAISFLVTTPKSGEKCRLYLLDTDMTTFAPAGGTVPVEDATLVYEDVLPFNDQGWAKISFDNVYEHDPSKNLMVIMVNTTGEYTAGLSFATYHGSSGYASAYNTDDNDQILPGEDAYYSLTDDRNVIRLHEASNVIYSNVGALTENANDNIPFNSYYNYGFSEQIYTTEELGSIRRIDTLGWYVKNAVSDRVAEIYLVDTFKKRFESAYDIIDYNNATKVYDGTLPFDAPGWDYVSLDTPFYHNPTKNLAVIVINKTGLYKSGLECADYADTDSRTVFGYRDNGILLPVSGTSSTSTPRKNVMRFLTGDVAKVNVTFEPNGPEEESYTQSITAGFDSSLLPNSFYYYAHDMKGWNTEPDGSGTAYANKGIINTNSDITLYAQWEQFPDDLRQVGRPDDSSNLLPNDFWYKYGFSEQIYTSDEIGDVGIISSISFMVTSPTPGQYKGAMYLMDTDKSEFTDSSEFTSISNAVKVYDGDLPGFGQDGWTEIELNSFYRHDPEKNLMLIFVNKTGNCYKGNTFATYHTEAFSSIKANTDAGYIDPYTYERETSMFQAKNVIRLRSFNEDVTTITYKPNCPGLEDITMLYRKGSTFNVQEDVFKREDAYMIGWNAKANGSSRAFEMGETITRSKDLVVYAQWKSKPAVTFLSNDGTDQEYNQYFMMDEPFILRYPSIRRDGFFAESWNTMPDGSGESYEIGAQITRSEPITLYAQWSRGAEIVDPGFHFSNQNGQCSIPITDDKKYSRSIQIQPASEIGNITLISSLSFFVITPGFSNNNIDIYLADIDSSILEVRSDQLVDLSEATEVFSGTVPIDEQGWQKIPFDHIFEHDPEKNLAVIFVCSNANTEGGITVFSMIRDIGSAFYAYSDSPLTDTDAENCYSNQANRIEMRFDGLAAEDVVKITYKPNGGEGDDIEETILKYKATPLRLNTFKYLGYKFTGWNKQPDGSGTSYTDGRKVTRTKPLILYAQWEKCPVITYHANGGSGDDYWQNADSDVINIMGNEFNVKPGCLFIGWNTMADGSGDSYDTAEEISVSSNMDLYAQWEEFELYDFSSSALADGWTFIDNDGDGFTWRCGDNIPNDFYVHSGERGDRTIISSASYLSTIGPLSPDNWAVSPAGKVKTVGSKEVSFWAFSQDRSYPDERFAVYAAEKSNADLEHFDPTQWTQVSPTFTSSGAEWTKYTADLSDFAGKEVYVAIRHYETRDMFSLNIDDVILPFEYTLKTTFKHNCGFNESLALYYAIPAESVKDFDSIALNVEREVYESGADEPTTINTTLTKYTETTIGGKEMYMFEYKDLTATDMGCTVRAVLAAEKNGVICRSAVDEYSIQEYVLDRLNNSSNEQYKKMLVDLLNYGAASQIHFNKDPEHLVNEVLTEEQKALGTQTAPELMDNSNEIEVSGATATFNGKNLSFDNNVVMALRIKLPEGADMSKIRLKVNYTTSSGTEITKTVKGSSFTQSGEYWIAEVKGIAMTDFRSVMDIAVYSGSKQISNTLQYSVESYAVNRLSNPTTSDSFKDLLREMMKFSISAEAHFS